MRGPAMPANRTFGHRARTAWISVAASASPDVSPATMPTVTAFPSVAALCMA